RRRRAGIELLSPSRGRPRASSLHVLQEGNHISGRGRAPCKAPRTEIVLTARSINMHGIFPPPDELLELEPEDLAPLVLRYLSQAPRQELHRYNFTIQSGALGAYAGARYEEIARAITEAWIVLEREGLIAPMPNDSSGG